MVDASNEIQYTLIPPENEKEISEFLINNFFPNEPISRALGLPKDQVKRWFPGTIAESLKHNCSFQAIDVKSGEVVGVAINILVEKNLHDSSSEGRGLLELLNPETEPIMVEIANFLGILNQVPNQVYKSGLSKDGCVRTMNCIYLNVLKNFERRGIGRNLVKETEKLASTGGIGNISFVQVDTTSEFSFRIFQQCGFPVIREIPLRHHLPTIVSIDKGVHKLGRILLKAVV